MKLLLLFSIIASCARLSSLPPDSQTAQKLITGTLNRPLKLEEVWFSLYQNGKKARDLKQYAKACEQFGRLVSFEDFPLSPLANLYHLETCALTGNAFPADALNDLEATTPSGFISEFREVSYSLAVKFGDPLARAKAALALAKERSLRAQKEQLYREAWELAPAGELKEEAAKALFKYAPRFNPNPDFDDYPSVARDFERSREFAEAKLWYQKIIKEGAKKDFDRWLNASKRYRMIFKNQRDNDGFLRETNALKVKLEKLVKKKHDEKVIDSLADMMVQEARARWTQNYRTDGELILNRALEFLPTMSADMKAQILWIKGMMALEAKNHLLAKSLFKQSIDQDAKDPKVYQDAVWNLAWTHYLDGENDDFLEVVAKAQEKLGDEMREKLEFWKGKALYRAGRIPLAIETWESLYKKSPFNYYGLMAHASSGGAFEPISATLNDEAISPQAEWLAALNEWDICRNFLDDWRAAKHLDSTKEKWLATFIRCRHASGAIRLYYSHSKSSDPEFMARHLASLFPLSFKAEVFSAGERFKVDPFLMQSIIRQESAFNPEARSPADAFGLMQLIPELAKRLAHKHRVKYRGYDDLYEAQTNVTLGAAYIKELNQKMNKRMVGIIAAYNAGTGPISNWYRTRAREDVFEFIEGIAYEETRNYVKLVLRNWIIYQQIEKSVPFTLDLKDLH